MDRRDSVLAISEALLQFEGDSTYVEIKTEDGAFQKRYVTTGLSDGINIELLEGVQKGDELKLWNLSEGLAPQRGRR